MSNTVLEVSNLTTQFSSKEGPLSAVKGISFSIEKGETVCIVGESGCGKSLTALSLLGLLPKSAKISSGSIKFKGKELIGINKEEMRQIRGNDISMIFQEPMTALNPVFTIGFQMREVLMNHLKISKSEANSRCIDLLKQVELPSPEQRLNQYPHELSGGMRQRIMIAIGLACNPELLIADEPTTALDVTIQAQILDLIEDLKEKFDMSVLLITHDMGVVAEIADRVIVMYAGEIIEEGYVHSIFTDPQHPYTKGLLNSVPNVDHKEVELKPILGTLPSLKDNIQGCLFHSRCEYVMEKCVSERPPTFMVDSHHKSKCWLQEVNVHDKQSAVTSTD